MKQRFVLAALVAILSAAMLLIPLQHSLQAQVGATIDLTAIEKILAPRQTLTAIQVNAQLQTIQANVTSTAGAVLTSTFYALTSTATPSITFTPSSTVSPSPFIPTATLDQTQVSEGSN